MSSDLMLIVALSFMILGVSLSVAALRHRKEPTTGVRMFHPRHWIPIWQQRDQFSAGGYQLYLLGTTLLCVGALIVVVHFVTV